MHSSLCFVASLAVVSANVGSQVQPIIIIIVVIMFCILKCDINLDILRCPSMG